MQIMSTPVWRDCIFARGRVSLPLDSRKYYSHTINFSKITTMKTLLTILMAALCISASAQKLDTIPKINGQYGYQEVVTLDTSAHKAELFKKAKLYFVNNFKSANDVIQYQDSSEGRIVGKGYFEIEAFKKSWGELFYTTWQVFYTTEIECRDGKYRYTLYDIKIKQIQGSGTMRINNTYTDLTINEAYKLKPGHLYKDQQALLIKKLIESFYNSINVLKESMIKRVSFANNEF